jgi:hypothetical protein
MELVDEIRAELTKRVDLGYREGCRNFFKEEVHAWGVRSADLKRIEVLEFLRLHSFPRLVVRYAAEKMSKSDRAELAL